MVTKEQIATLNRTFSRIFALPISRMTMREIQNSMNEVFTGKQEIANSIYESLLKGESNDKVKALGNKDVGKFIDDFSMHVRFAREVAEKGEFMNSFSCDFLQQGNQLIFVNRMRRLDGQEYYFMSAPETNIRLGRMFINRLRELKDGGTGLKLSESLIEELKQIKKDIDSLLK